MSFMSGLIHVFCNSCMRNFDKRQPTTFVITNCYHVYCDHCKESSRCFCGICNTNYNALPIDENIPEGVRQFLTMRSLEKKMENVVKIFNFQNSQYKLWQQTNLKYKVEVSKQKRAKYNGSVEKLNNIKVQMKKEKDLYTRIMTARKLKKVTVALIKENEAECKKRGMVFGFSFMKRSSQKISPNAGTLLQTTLQRNLLKSQKMPQSQGSGFITPQNQIKFKRC